MDQKEKQVRDILKSRQLSVDSSEIWQNISGALPRKKKKVAAYWWFGLLLLPLAALAYYATSDKEDSFVDPVENNYAIEREESADEIEARAGLVMGSRKITTPENTYDKAKEKLLPEDSNNGNRSDNKREYTNGKKNENVLRNESGVGENKSKGQDSNTINNSEIGLSSPSANQVIVNDRSRKEIHFPMLNWGGIGIDELIVDVQTAEELGMMQTAHLTATLCCAAPKYSIVFLAGGNRSFDKILGISDQERGLYGLSMDGRFDIALKKRWSLRLGMSYDQMINRYESVGLSSIEREGSGLSEITIDALGQSSNIAGTVIETVYRSNEIKWHRRHQSVDLDLALSKRFVVNHRLGLSIFGGMSYNLLTKSKGFAYVTDEKETIEKFENDPGFYLQRAGFKPKTGIEISYAIGSLEILLNTNYEWNLKPINTHLEFYQIKHSQTGIQLGTRYYLNGNKN